MTSDDPSDSAPVPAPSRTDRVDAVETRVERLPDLSDRIRKAGAAPLERAVETCLAAGRAAPAHVVNLGHGVPPGADPAVLTGVVARVHGSTSWARTAAEPWEPDA